MTSESLYPSVLVQTTGSAESRDNEIVLAEQSPTDEKAWISVDGTTRITAAKKLHSNTVLSPASRKNMQMLEDVKLANPHPYDPSTKQVVDTSKPDHKQGLFRSETFFRKRIEEISRKIDK